MGGVQGREAFPIEDVPYIILEHILSFIDGKELLKSCSLVCRTWKVVIDSSSLWKKKCERELPAAMIPFIGGSSPLDYKRICIRKPYNRNLVKNWNASENLAHWDILANGGDMFQVEPDKCSYADPVSSIGLEGCTKCWATSFGWCSKAQTIDLVKEGLTAEVLDQLKPEITFSDWTAARGDCGSIYTCCVILMDGNQQALKGQGHVFEEEKEEDQWQGQRWNKVEHTFKDYQDGLRFIRVEHSGKDRQFWAGHYGSKFTGTSVIVRVTPECVEKWSAKHNQN